MCAANADRLARSGSCPETIVSLGVGVGEDTSMWWCGSGSCTYSILSRVWDRTAKALLGWTDTVTAGELVALCSSMLEMATIKDENKSMITKRGKEAVREDWP